MATSGNEGSQECKQWGFPIGTINARTNEEIQSVYLKLECPVCHEFPLYPVFSCKQNQHMICEKCIPASKKCPVCSAPISESRCTSAEKCITDFLTPCKYKFEGCPYMLRGKDVRDHIQSCLYRPTVCIMSKCNEQVPFKELFNHLTSAHQNKINGILDSNKHNIEWWIEGDTSTTARWPPFYFTCFDNVFLYMCVSTIHGTWEWVWILASDEESRRFRFETKMEGQDKIVSIQFKGPVHSIRKPIKEIISSGQVFVTNSKEIRNPFIFHKGGTNKSYWRSEVQIYQVAPRIPTSIPYIVTQDANKTEVNSEKGNDNWSYSVRSESKLVDRMLPNNTGRQLQNDSDRQHLNDNTTGHHHPNNTGRQFQNDNIVQQFQTDNTERFQNENKRRHSQNENEDRQLQKDAIAGLQHPHTDANTPGLQNPNDNTASRDQPENTDRKFANDTEGPNNQAQNDYNKQGPNVDAGNVGGIVDSEYSLRLDADGTYSQNFPRDDTPLVTNINTIQTQTITPKRQSM